MKAPRLDRFLRFALGLGIGSALNSQERTVQPMRGVNRGQVRPAQATLLIGVNEVTGSIAEPGWPLIVSASQAPDEKYASIPLPANLKLKLTTQTGDDMPVTFTPVPPPPNATSSSTVHWIATKEATARLPLGRFRLAAISGQPELASWRVEIGELQFVAPDPANARAHTLLEAQRSILLGLQDEAIAHLDRLIAANAGDKEAWIAKGDILMKADLPDEALQAYDTALSLHKKTDREPVAIQARRRSAFFRSLEKRGVIAPKPAAP